VGKATKPARFQDARGFGDALGVGDRDFGGKINHGAAI
jgi:hypothetical protein